MKSQMFTIRQYAYMYVMQNNRIVAICARNLTINKTLLAGRHQLNVVQRRGHRRLVTCVTSCYVW